jgi:drug/metabolite transporter (DMT)-like permease
LTVRIEGSISPVGDDRRQLLVRAMPWLFVLIWSTGFVVARYAMPHAPPFKFLVMRYVLSFACFVVWVLAAGISWPARWSQRLHLGVVGALLHAGYLGGVWAAVKSGIGAGTVALIVGLQPVLTAVWVSSVDARSGNASARALGARQWLGLGLGLTGLTLVVWHRLGGGEITAFNLGCAVFGLVSITTGTLYQKRHVAPCDVRSASAIQLLAAFVVTLPLALNETEAIAWHPHLIGALAWSVGVLTLGGSSLLYLLIQHGAATRVTSLMYLVPPCTAVLAWALFAEPVSPATVVGIMLTVSGVALVVREAASPASGSASA